MSLNMIKIPVIYHGKGCLKELKGFRQERILIVTDKRVWELLGEKLSRQIKKKESKVFDEIEPDRHFDIFHQRDGHGRSAGKPAFSPAGSRARFI